MTNDNIDESPLTLAVYVRNVYAVKLLLKNGYDVNELHHYSRSIENGSCMENKGTPLTHAIWLDITEVVTVLLEAGADVIKWGPQGQTALGMAKGCVSPSIAKGLPGRAKDSGLEDCEGEIGSRDRIFTMVCADLKIKQGKGNEDDIDATYEDFFWASRLRFAGILVAYFDLARSELIDSRSPPANPSLLGETHTLCLLPG